MIRTWLSFFTGNRVPHLREWPLTLVKVSSFGAALGLAASLPMLVASAGPADWPRIIPVLARAVAGASILSLCFYITCGIPGIILPGLLAGLPELPRRILIALSGGLNAALGVLLSAWLLKRLFGTGLRIAGEEHLGFTLLVTAVAGSLLSLVILIVVQARQQAEAAARKLIEARFSALQSQINPHFLFNTLNSIYTLIPRRPEQAQEMVGRLADLFRYALASQSATVTLDEELEFVRGYLALEQARFSDRLRVTLPQGDFGRVRLPGLTLQPLVENGVKYGIAALEQGGTIEIAVAIQGSRCRLTVTSPFDPACPPDLSETRLFREGHALANIRERLRIQWNGRSSISLSAGPDATVRAEIEFPVES